MSTKLSAGTVAPLAELAESWLLGLEAEHKSPATLRAYQRGVDGFLGWHAARAPAEPVLDRPAASAYLADLRRAGRAPPPVGCGTRRCACSLPGWPPRTRRIPTCWPA